MRTRTSIAALAVSLAVLGAACSGDDDDAARTDETEADQAVEEHNEADVEFAQMMIPHHRQAIEMAELAPDRADDPRILDIAVRVQAAQGPEIERMSQWLEAWGEDVPAEDSEDHGMNMGSEATMAGEMSADDMAALEAASGAEFDRMFGQMLIEHHQGAIEMANEEINNGESPDAIALAEDIVAAQEAEIIELQDFLAEPR